MISQTDLKYFIELTKTLHLTRASERLAVTQPTLTHSLKRLEAEIGCELFIRSKKGLTLTAAGERLKTSADDLLSRWSELKSSVVSEVVEAQGVIKLGCHTAVAQYILKEFLGEFLNKNLKVEVKLSHGLSRYMTEQVISHQLDVAFAVNPVEHADLIIKPICNDEVGLWKSKDCLNADVLIVDGNLVQSQNILAKLEKKGLHFKRVIESSSLEVVANLVASGVGYGIVPSRVVKLFEEAKLEKVKESPVFNDKICLVFRSEFRKNKRGELFINSVKSVF